MWVSSFARGGGAHGSSGEPNEGEGVVAVRAHVWGSEQVPRRHGASGSAGKAAAGAPFGVQDALTLAATTDVALLRRLRVVNGSFVAVEFKGRAHVARLVLVASEDAYALDEGDATDGSEAVADVTLSPLLAFNLDIPIHAVKGSHVAVTVSVRAMSSQELGLSPSSSPASLIPSLFRRKHQEHPAPATYALIAPLLVSSLSCSEHASMKRPDGLLEAIRGFFASAQVLQAGDVFAVVLRETSQTHALSGSEHARAAAAYAPYKPVDIPAAYLVKRSADAESLVPSAASTVLTPPTLNVDTSLVFFRVEKLDAGGSCAIALTVSEGTELVQGTPVSASAPDETSIKKFLSFCRYHDAARVLPAPIDTSLPTPAVNKLYDVLYPSLLCDIPTSVLLSGPRGVGKRTLVYQAAKYLGVLVVEVPFTELTGQSELHLLENVREQVVKARALSPCLLYISHFFPVDKENDEAELRIGAALSECIRTLSQHNHNIPLVACVEDKSDVPKYIRQCFLYEMQLEAPDLSGRVDFLRHVVSSVRLSSNVDLKEVAQLTAGRTYGELSSIVADAGALAVHRAIGESDDADGEDILELLIAPPVPEAGEATTELAVTADDLEAAIKNQQAQSSSNSKVSNASIPNVKWSDVGGLEDVKDEILDVVQLPINHPELFASGVRQRSGILLYGPPGTGKTLLAKAIATECNLNFLSVKGPELLNMYIGESEKNVRQVFAKARSCRPCILFFDELDSLAPMRGRGSDSGGVMDRVVSQLLTEIDGLSGGGNDQVFVIGATNRPDLLETGLLRPGRFDRLLYLGICSERPAQLKVLKAQTRKFTMGDDVDLEAVVEQCPLHFTGADFYALSSSALAAALKDRVDELDRHIEEINAADCYSSSPMTVRMLLNRLPAEELRVPVRQSHFLSALASVVPSVSPAELAHYENLKRQYSSR